MKVLESRGDNMEEFINDTSRSKRKYSYALSYK